MADDELRDRLKNLERPTFRAEAAKAQLKLTLVGTRTSSRVGIALVLLPAVFVFGVILHYGFGLEVPGFSQLEDFLSWTDHQKYVPLLSPLIMAGAPLAALALNLLAIMHVEVDRARHELVVTFKLRVVNIVIIAVATLVLIMLAMHAVAESGHRPGRASATESTTGLDQTPLPGLAAK